MVVEQVILTFASSLGIDISGTGTLNVNSGNTTLGGQLTVTGTCEFNDVTRVDANFAVRTAGGTDRFSVKSTTGNVATDGNLQVAGDTDLGSDANDSLTINAVVDSNVIPSGTGATYNLGSSAQKWEQFIVHLSLVLLHLQLLTSQVT